VAASPDLTTKADQVVLAAVELITAHSASTEAAVVEPLSATAGVVLVATAAAVQVASLFTEGEVLRRLPSSHVEAVVAEPHRLVLKQRLARLERTASSSLPTKFKDRT
jgi:hypothetical protein